MAKSQIFLVLVALVSLTWGWEPNTQYTYKYSGRSAVGIYSLKQQNAVVELQSRVIIQGIDQDTVVIKLADYQLKRNGNYQDNPYFTGEYDQAGVELNPPHPQEIEGQDEQLPNQQYLSAPFTVHLNKGVFSKVEFGAEEPQWVINFKKSIVGQLQLDLTGVRRDGPVQDIEQVAQQGLSAAYNVFEETISGDCSTKITINRLKPSQVYGLDAFQLGSFDAYCKDKPVYEVVKTKDFNRCQNSPIYYSAIPDTHGCSFDNAACKDFMQRTSLFKFIGCGDSVSQLTVIHGSGFSDFLVKPLGYQTEELVNSVIINWALEKKEGISSRLPQPQPANAHDSLYYVPEDIAQIGPDGQPQIPSLEQPLLKSPVPLSVLQSNVLEVLRSVSQDLKEKPDSQQDNLERLNTIGRVWPMFSLDDLRNVWQQVKQEEPALITLFIDTLVQSGSNPSVMLIKELIESQQITGGKAMFALAAIGYHVKTPTEQLLQQLVQLAKSGAVQTPKSLKQTAAMTVADLLHAAGASKFVSQKRFATAYWKDLKQIDSQSPVIQQEFLPWLLQEIQQSGESSDRIIYLTALGSLGVEEIIPELARYAQGTPGQDDDVAERVQAVLALQRVAQIAPEKVQPILTALAANVGERPEIRKAALYILLRSDAPQAIWQKFAASTWFEPSTHFATYVASLIQSLAEMDETTPEHAQLAQKARIALPMLKSLPFGTSYSFHDIRSTYLPDQDISVKMGTINYQVPGEFMSVFFQNRYFYQLGPLASYPLTVNFWNYNMYDVWSSLVGQLYQQNQQDKSLKDPEAYATLQKLWESLNVSPRPQDKRAGLIQINLMDSINYFLKLDHLQDAVPALLRQLPKYRGMPYDLSLIKYRLLAEYNVRLPTDLGFPMRFLASFPMIVSLQGGIGLDGLAGLKSDLNAEVGWKINSELRVELPFIGKYIGSGVDVRVELRAPKDLQFGYQNGQLKVTWTPGSKVTDLLYYHVKPYTVSRSLADSVIPALEDKQHTYIISVNDKPRQASYPLGGRYGLNVQLLTYSELEHHDLFQWYQWIKKWDINGISNLGFLPFKLNDRQYIVRYDPSGSRARAVQAFFEYQYVTKTCQHTIVYQSGSSQPNTPSAPEILSKRPLAAEFRPVLEGLFKDVESGNAQLLRAGITVEQRDGQSVHFNATLGLSKNAWYNKDFTDLKIEKYTTTGPSSAGNKQVDYAICYKAARNWNKPPQSGFSKDVLYLTEDDYIGFGSQCDQSKIRIKFKVYRDDAAAKAAINSEVGQKCQQDLAGGFKYGSPACTEARRLDQTYNNYEMSAEAEELPQQAYDWLNQIRRWINQKLYPFTVKHVTSEGNPPNRASWIVKRDPLTGDSNFTFTRPMETLVAHNVRFDEDYTPFSPLAYAYSKIFYPLYAESNFIREAAQITTGGASEAKCYVGSEGVHTYDAAYYNYTIDQCQHILLTDCSQKTKLAVLARQGSEGQKIVTVVYHSDVIELDPNGFVTINGNKQNFKSLDKESRFELRDQNNKFIRAVVYPSSANGVVLEIRNLHLFVKVQGSHVQLSAGQYLRGSACGLCGDYNQESHDDYKTPERCAVSSGELMAASFKLPSGEGCSSSKNEIITRRLKKETQNCQKADQYYKTSLPQIDLKAPTKCTRYQQAQYQGAYVQGQCQSQEYQAVCQPGCKPYSLATAPFTFKCQGQLADFTAPLTVPTACITA